MKKSAKTDPVCGMDVSRSFQYSSRTQGIDYFFCSESCFKKFKENPKDFQLEVGEPVEIRSGAYWVGAQDQAEKLSINSYLVVGDKIGLIYDSISRNKNETMGKAGKVVDVDRIDYLIPTHYFYGQCCGFAGVATMLSNSELIASEATTRLQTLAHLRGGRDVGRIIGDSKQIIDFGDRKLHVFPSRLAGTYGSLFVYDDKSRILFSGDFLSSPLYEWDAKAKSSVLAHSIKGYQAMRNPWLRMASKAKLKDEVSKLKSLKIEIVAPSEGTIIRSGIDECLEAYLDICA